MDAVVADAVDERVPLDVLNDLFCSNPRIFLLAQTHRRKTVRPD